MLIITGNRGKVYMIALAHPEGACMKIHMFNSQTKRERNPSGEFAELIERAVIYNPLLHLQ